MANSRAPRKSPLIPDRTSRYPVDQIEHGISVLSVLASVRFASSTQLQRMIFDRISDSPRQARYRSTRTLRRLFDAGYIRRMKIFAPSSHTGLLSLQMVQTLAPSGARMVGMEARRARLRAPRAREVLIHDFWLVELATLAIEARPPSLHLQRWWNDRTLAGRKRQGLLSLTNIPDAFMLVAHPVSGKLYPFLVELDLGTESVSSNRRVHRDFGHKIAGYLEYLGAPFRRDFEVNAPPIVLIVTNSERRLSSLRASTMEQGGGGRYWFSTLDRLHGSIVSNPPSNFDSAARQSTFWTSNWQTAADEEVRNLAARCGV